MAQKTTLVPSGIPGQMYGSFAGKEGGAVIISPTTGTIYGPIDIGTLYTPINTGEIHTPKPK